MKFKHKYVFLVIILSLFLDACELKRWSSNHGCHWKEVGTMIDLFPAPLTKVINYTALQHYEVVHMPPRGGGDLYDWRDNHSKDNTYFTTRVDYCTIEDTIFCRKIDLLATRDSQLTRHYYKPVIDGYKIPMSNRHFDYPENTLGYGWDDYCNSVLLKGEEKRIIEKEQIELKAFLKEGFISYYYRNDTLAYIEGSITPLREDTIVYVEFILDKKYLYAFRQDSFITPKFNPAALIGPPMIIDGYVVLLGSGVLREPTYSIGKKYFFKKETLIATSNRDNNPVCRFTKKQREEGKEFLRNYYEPLKLLITIN